MERICCIYTLCLKLSHSGHSRVPEQRVMNLTFFSENLYAHFIHAVKVPQYSDENSFANWPNDCILTRPIGFDVHNTIERCFFDIQFVCQMPTLQCTSIITDTLSFLGLIYIVKYIIHSSTNYSPLNGVNIVKMFLKIRTNHDDICRVTTGQKIKYIL